MQAPLRDGTGGRLADRAAARGRGLGTRGSPWSAWGVAAHRQILAAGPACGAAWTLSNGACNARHQARRRWTASERMLPGLRGAHASMRCAARRGHRAGPVAPVWPAGLDLALVERRAVPAFQPSVRSTGPPAGRLAPACGRCPAQKRLKKFAGVLRARIPFHPHPASVPTSACHRPRCSGF